MSWGDTGPGVPLIEAVADAVAAANGIVIVTGASVSAESGVPTFRQPDGLWSRHDPTQLATPDAFARNPRSVWEWYELRRQAIARCEPNAGHQAIARLLALRHDVTLVTQNVDGLHHHALSDEAEGAPAAFPAPSTLSQDRILELHGRLTRSRCSRCGAVPEPDDSLRGNGAQRVAVEGGEPENGTGDLPACDACGGLLRPDVVWFGETPDADVLDAAFDAARRAELCVVVGTSAVVHPAASVPLSTLESGGDLVEVNPEATPLSTKARWSLRGRSAAVLPAILER